MQSSQPEAAGTGFVNEVAFTGREETSLMGRGCCPFYLKARRICKKGGKYIGKQRPFENERDWAEGTGRGVGFRKELGITFLQSQGREKRPDGESENC